MDSTIVTDFLRSAPPWLASSLVIVACWLFAWGVLDLFRWLHALADSKAVDGHGRELVDDDIPTDILAARELKAQRFAEARRRRELDTVVRLGDYRALPKARGQR